MRCFNFTIENKQSELNIERNNTNLNIQQGGTVSSFIYEADHTKLINRDVADQHPISAITNLQSALDFKQPIGDYASSSDIPTQLSQLENDTGFITNDVNNLENYTDNNTLNSLLQSKADAQQTNDSIEELYGDVSILYSTKQNKLTFDTTPTTNSTNPVTSNGIKTYIDNILGDIEMLLSEV